MKYKFKIFGVPPEKSILEIDVDPDDTVLDVKKKIIAKLDFPFNPKELKIEMQE